MQVLQAQIENSIITEISYLNGDISANTGTLIVDNAENLSTNDYLIIEKIGTEIAEIVKVAGVIGQTITLSANTVFAHTDNTLVQKVLYNQRKFYRATSKTGVYSLLAGGTKDIEVDRPEGTAFEDSVGLSTSWYKATYYNSTTLQETSLDDCTPSGGNDSDHYTSIYAIRKQAGLEESYGITEETISDYRDEAEGEFESRIAIVYSVPLTYKSKIVRQIVNLLAAGNLLIKEYGMEADIEISKSGARMLARANELIDKIVNGTLKLLDENGVLLGTIGTFMASCSNVYEGSNMDKGSMFNIGDEIFNFKDPEHPRT
jgi:hypothetical protein